MRRAQVVLLIVTLASTCEARTALAQCLDPVAWQIDAGLPVATRVSSDSRFGLGLSFIAAGGSLMAVWNESGLLPFAHTAGQVLWTTALGGTIQNFPNPVPLKGGGEAVFVAANGLVYRISAASGAIQWSRDLKRMSCPGDLVVATPAVQLWDSSNASFRTKFADDLVLAITRHFCGDATDNEVFALSATDGSTQWEFRPSVSLGIGMDGGSAAGTIAYATNRIYLGTNQGGGTQPTLWALSTLDGALAWSRNVGAIQNRPMLAGTRLYVGTVANRLRAHLAATGAPIWVDPLPTSTTGGLAKDLCVPTEPAWNHILFVTDGDGSVWSLFDDTTLVAPTVRWKYSDQPLPAWFVTTAPVLDADVGRVYVGRSDGSVRQLSAATGIEDAVRVLCSSSPVVDLTLDVTAPGDTAYERLIAPQDSRVARLCIPWAESTIEDVGCGTVSVGPRGAGAALLEPPRPNPVQTRSRFVFHLAVAGHVDIAIYDLQGQHVRTLSRAWQEAGEHSVAWDGRRDGGALAGAGVYFCRLRIEPGGLVTSEPVVLLR